MLRVAAGAAAPGTTQTSKLLRHLDAQFPTSDRNRGLFFMLAHSFLSPIAGNFAALFFCYKEYRIQPIFVMLMKSIIKMRS
jgi:hypothetical protein